MLPSTHLPVGISTEDCLAWSSDNELAISAGEEVYILIPRSKGGEAWIQIHFRVNTFTYDEWPLQRQASFADMSIGEEQAKVTVISLSWSPPGLAKHRRSVLAILTSNLLVSLWAPGGNRASSECWQRVMILDQTRVRCVTWAPASPPRVGTQGSLFGKYGTHLLAIAGEDNKILVLSVWSPFNSVAESWIAEEIGHEPILPTPQIKSRPSLLRNALSPKNFIDYVAFGAWDSAGNLGLTYRSSNSLYQLILAVTFNPLRAALETPDAHQPVSPKNERPPTETSSSMQGLLQRHKKKYGIKNHLDPNNVILKTWGLAASGSLVVICTTSHPARMVEYQAASESYSTVLFDDSEASDNPDSAFPWQKTTDNDEGEAFRTILLTILDRQHLGSLNITFFDLKILYAAIHATLFHRMSEQQRLPCLNASTEVLDLLEAGTGIKLQAVRESINARKVSKDIDLSLLDHSTEQEMDSPSRDAKFLNACPICENTYVGSTFIGDKFWEAYCPKKHPFARCALTFLPIIEPGHSKRCETCNREFLNEEKFTFDTINPSVTSGRENEPIKPSLSTFLFDRFDVCPYCGGKYCD